MSTWGIRVEVSSAMPQFIITNKDSRKEFAFPANVDILTIGRARTNDIVLPDPTFKVSRSHAAVVKTLGQAERYFIRDLSSVHGTRIDGTLINQHVLGDGDVLQISDYLLSYSEQVTPPRAIGRLRLGTRNSAEVGFRSSTRFGTESGVFRESVLGPEKREVLTELLQRAGRARDVKSVFQELLAPVLVVLGAQRGLVGLFRPSEGDLYDEIAVEGMHAAEQIDISDAFALNRLMEGESFQEGRTALVPVAVSGEIKGFFCVDRRQASAAFSDEELSFLRNVALLAAGHLRAGATKPAYSDVVDELVPWPLEIIGRSRPMQDLFQGVHEAASTDMNVLILGESGTGKELIAKAIHNKSAHASGPFIARNCASITETLAQTEIFGHAARSGIYGADPQGSPGWFELADGGSLLLDEIQALTLPVQDQFLRVLQEKEVLRVRGRAPRVVNVKIVAATDQDLEQAVSQGRFRQALYYRFGKKLLVPPLRDRKDDIPLLVHSFLDEYSTTLQTKTRSLSHRALQLLMNFHWPGNVRELKDCIRDAVSNHKEVLLSWDLDNKLSKQPQPPLTDAKSVPLKTMTEIERDKIMESLEATRGNISRAQILLGYKSRQTMLNKMDEYNIPRSYGDAPLT